METSVETSTMTDGSIAWAVVFVEGSATVRIECVDRKSAYALAESIREMASYATVNV